MWPFDSLFHIPLKTLRIFSESTGWSTLSRTISQSFSCLDISVRIRASVRSDDFSISPKRNAKSFTQLSNFSSSSMENQNTPPSYCGLCSQANWAAKVVFPHPPRPQMAAILNLWSLFSERRHLSSDSNSFCLPVNLLFRSGASNTIDLSLAAETLESLNILSRSCLVVCSSCLLLLNSCNFLNSDSSISCTWFIFSCITIRHVSSSGLPTQNSNPRKN